MQVTAVDPDSGLNAELEYFICSPITPIVYEGTDMNYTTAFAMDPVTGTLQLNFDPQKNQKGYFGFDVCVRDVGGNSDTAQVYIYLLREDNTIVEARDVIQTLDYNTEQLDPFFKEYNVLQTETASAALASKQSSPEMVILLWLVGLCIFLVITLTVVICVCLTQRYKYSRKLRAATTAAFGSQAASDIIIKSEAVVPNTNRHAMEGSNP